MSRSRVPTSRTSSAPGCVLLVASPYDAFILEQDEQLDERGLNELDHMPDITAVSSGAEGAGARGPGPRPRLILTTSTSATCRPSISLWSAGRTAGNPGRPPSPTTAAKVSALRRGRRRATSIERLFLWQGDVRILLGIVESLEDR